MEFTKEIKFNIDPQAECNVEIEYSGFLSNSPELWIVYGFDEAWNNTSEVKMEKTENGFKANIDILDFKTFNFCFKNANNVWDNNNNSNYVSSITPSYNSQLISLFDELFVDEISEDKEITTKESSVSDFDLDSLIEELLEPLKSASLAENISSFTSDELVSDVVSEDYIDLADIANEEFLEIPEEKSVVNSAESVTNDAKEDVSSIAEINNSLDIENVSFEYTKENSTDTELSSLVDPRFAISPRKLNKFYLFKKRIKLIAYKIARLPQLIFGENNE